MNVMNAMKKKYVMPTAQIIGITLTTAICSGSDDYPTPEKITEQGSTGFEAARRLYI